MDSTDKAYMAGIFDGEGSVGIYLVKGGKGYSYHALKATVSMVEPVAVTMLHEAYGGGLFLQDVKANSRTRLNFNVHGQNCVDMLIDLSPYLRVKRPQADVAIEYWYARTDMRWEKDVKGKVTTVRMTEEEWQLRESFRLRMFALNSGKLGKIPNLCAVVETEWRGAARKSRDATVRTMQECIEVGRNDRPTPATEG